MPLIFANVRKIFIVILWRQLTWAHGARAHPIICSPSIDNSIISIIYNLVFIFSIFSKEKFFIHVHKMNLKNNKNSNNKNVRSTKVCLVYVQFNFSQKINFLHIVNYGQ